MILSAGGALVDAQLSVDSPCHCSMLFTYIELIVHQDPQVPF